MALELLHKMIEELVLDVVCREERIGLAKLGEYLKRILGRSPKTLLDLHIFFDSDENRKSLPTSLLPFVQNIPPLHVSYGTVTLSDSPDGQRALMAWKSCEKRGIAQYRQDILKRACRILFSHSSHRMGPHRMKDGRGNTLLHLVAGLPSNTEFYDLQNEAYVTLLMRNGADLRERNDLGFTPIHIVSRRSMVNDNSPNRIRSVDWPAKNRCKMLKSMTRGTILSESKFEACVMERAPNGNNVLHEWVLSSIKTEHIEDELQLGELIIHHLGILPDTSRNDEGCTPLHYAFDDDLFEFLLENGAHENRNSKGETPLLSIIKRGIVGDQNRDKLLGTNSHEQSPIEVIIGMVCERKQSLLACDRKGNHAIDVLLRSLTRASYEPGQILQACKTVESLLKRVYSSGGLDKDNVQPTAMVNTVIDCIESIYVNLEWLERELVDVSPLLNVMDMLLDNGANPNHVVHAPEKTSFLHKCCGMQRIPSSVASKLISILRTQGADPDLRDDEGLTPREILLQREVVDRGLLQTLNNTRPKKLFQVELTTETHKEALKKLCVSTPTVVECYRYDPAVCIGKGAIGSVFPAIDETGKREVALKRIEKDYNDKTVMTEIKALTKLTKYKQVVDYYHVVVSDPLFYFIVLELMEGDLADLIQQKRLALENNSTLVKLVGDVVKGLEYLHGQPNGGILHRDLKPGNVLYTIVPDVCLKLADFGLAKDTTGGSTLPTASGHSLTGTRGWMAPELVSKTQTKHTKETDIFSLGLVCHFLISKGKHPFDEKRAILTKDPASVQRILPYKLEQSIVEGTHYMNTRELTPAGYHLLTQLVARIMTERPKVASISDHCFFWDVHKKVQFLMAVGDQEEFAKYSEHSRSRAIIRLELSSLGRKLRDIPWDTVIPDLYNEMRAAWSRRKYNTTSLAELVRFFRNAYAHEEERSSATKAELKSNIFFRKFPSLLLTVWSTILMEKWDQPQSNRERQRIHRALSMSNITVSRPVDPFSS